jgi:ligand-binding sensor domain-containing protein
MKVVAFIISSIILMLNNAYAQPLALGQWYSMFPYTTANAVAASSTALYGGRYGLLQYNMADNSIETYTKVNGLSDVNINYLAFDDVNKALIITYENSNIDILKNKTIYNIPDIKLANVISSKKINNAVIYKGDAYLATGLGIVVINMNKYEVKATYPMQINANQSQVFDVAFYKDSIIALTSNGIFKADANNTILQNINNWNLLSPQVYTRVAIANDSLFTANDNTLYYWDGANTFTSIFTNTYTIKDVAYSSNALWVGAASNTGLLYKLSTSGNILYAFNGRPVADVYAIPGGVVAANIYGGMMRVTDNGLEEIKAEGPFSLDAFRTKIINNALYIIGGSLDNQSSFLYNRSGVSKFANDKWSYYNQYNNYPQMDSLLDIVDVEEDKQNGTIYMSSHGGGLAAFKKDGSVQIYKYNSPILSSENKNYAWLPYSLYNDADNNLWVTVANADNILLVKKPNDTWQSFTINTPGEYKGVSDIIEDDIGQKWIILTRNRGLLVFNYNNTIDNKNDDQSKIYTVAQGNLASNYVNCIAKDKTGKIWIGTDDGISIINCPENAFGTGGCDAENKIVQYDVDAGKLFQDQFVSSIAVDGANRKWVGTNNGAWLISDDAEKIFAYFNTTNSPLPSNEINKISVDPITGTVYFATLQGVVAYKSTATDGFTESEELIVYPNPVTPNYTGDIAIKGFTENAKVYITDASGQLVFKTTALGGQAIWNGRTYTGQAIASGVYYVFGSSADGSTNQRTKIVMYTK